MKLTTIIASTGLAAGLAVGGVAVAGAASSPAPSSNPGITLPKGGVLEQRVTNLCERAPKLEQRAGKAQKRLSADADTQGSIAALKARQAKVAKEHPKAAKRLGKVIERRSDRLARLPRHQENLAKAQTECATLPK